MASSSAATSDRLIWLAAGAIAAMGLAWLLIEAPWSGDTDPGIATSDTAAITTDASEIPSLPATGPDTDALRAPQDPLYMARLALEAGMLTEPSEYSAWTLFAAAADADPANAEAEQGLNQVATTLLGRGRTALEQGRLDDAEEIIAVIVARMPTHEGALELTHELVLARTPPPPVPPPPPSREAAEPEPAPVDRIPGLHADFMAAMGRNAVLTPPGSSARDIVTEMLARAPEHELSMSARDLIVTEMLDRSTQSLEALDAVAAQTWIDSAAPLAADESRIARAQERVNRQLIAAESRKLLPSSALEQIAGAGPQYPPGALSRDLEGWVELEFVVSPDGRTEAITVIDASHDRYFRDEAVAAVAQWRFRPVVFLGQAIPQRAYTRLAFVLD